MKKDKNDSKGPNHEDNQGGNPDGIKKAFPYNLPEGQSQEWHKSDQNTLVTQRKMFTYIFFLN